MTSKNRLIERAAALSSMLLCSSVAVTASAQPAQGDPAPPAEAPQPATAASPTEPAQPAASPAGAPLPEAAQPKWYDRFEFGAFADAYYSHNWRRPRPNSGANLYQPYTPNSGFSLSWVGLDASIDPAPVGATMQLRFGPSVPNLALGDFAIPGGIGFLQNAFVSWRPQGKDGKVTLMLGKFDTVFGAEVTQSQLNINYTRGYLYNLAQPFFHTGLRADIALSDLVGIKLLAVNGWNNTIDNNKGKSLGAQFALTPAEGYTFAVGYMGGPEESDVATVTCGTGEIFDAAQSGCVAATAGASGPTSGTVVNRGAESRLRHLVDVVADMKLSQDFRLIINGDYVTQKVVDATTGADKTVSWFGAAALMRYALSEVYAVGLRGEIVRDKDGQITAPNTLPLTLYTGTLTLEAAPSKYMLIRLDNRIDMADEAVFAEGLRGTSKNQLTSTLGVVVKTN